MTPSFVSPALLADPAPPPGAVTLVNGLVFDGTGNTPREADVVVVDGRIADGPPPSEARTIDVDGRFVMPGIIDVHTHLGEQPDVELAEGMEPLLPGTRGHLVAAAARSALAVGITTIRDVGARDDSVLEIRQAMRYGAFLGPRILSCGKIISATAPGGRLFAGMYREADGPDEMRKAVREQIRCGADFVKIMMTGARSVELENPAPSQVTPSEVAAVVGEAHRLGYRVAAHCEGLEGTILAIEHGVDTIEHGFYLHERPDLLDRMVANGQTLVPTLSFLDDVANQTHEPWSDHLVQRGAYNVEQAAKTLLAATTAGVPIAMGFDSKPESNAATELVRMVGAGMSERDALVAATSAGAAAIGLDRVIGTLEPGKMADLVVVDGNPLTDIEVLTHSPGIHTVMRSGHIVSHSP